MDFRYLTFCRPGEVFYDMQPPASDEEDFPAARAPLPEGWTRAANEDWVVFRPPGVELPEQGWKIHVTATQENAGRISRLVRDYCLDHGVYFKFIRSRAVLARRNSKYGDRGSSGKFVTLYPLDEDMLGEILDALDPLLVGEPGPYILSDLRWRQGPLYVRYGGFVAHLVRTESGEQVHCIKDPEGNWVPDVRGPGFRPPPWVTLPERVKEALEARNSGALTDFPYRPAKALHFSNGGGVYVATDTRDGTTVLLKEARPLAGLDADGTDAVARLRNEYWALRRLAGLDCMPAHAEFRKGNEHYYLAREYVEGKALGQEMQERNPLLGNGPATAKAFAAYTEWALGTLAAIEREVRRLHERGVVFGDLHPNNVLLRPDGSVVFIDLEASSEAVARASQAMAAPGYQAPAGYTGTDVDRYAMGCLRLGVFLPLTQVLPWSERKTEEFLALIDRHFPVPEDFAEQVRKDLAPPLPSGDAGALPQAAAPPAGALAPPWPVDGPDAESWPVLRRRLADGILAAATPGRTDRLYPGDIAQFHGSGGANFAYGAAGVAWALGEAGVEVPREHIDWLVSASARVDEPGFYDGLCGIAFALDALGLTAPAQEVLERARSRWAADDLDDSLFGGRSGIGLGLLHFAERHGDPAGVEEAVRLAERITGAANSGRRRPGLLHGGSGQALFLVRLFERTGGQKYLDAAVEALRADLAESGWAADKEARAPHGAWSAPVIAGGAGIALVADRVLAHTRDPEPALFCELTRERLAIPFFGHAGVFTGRAGAMLAEHALAATRPESAPARAALSSHLAALGLHAVPHGENPAFLGEQCLRLSTDLATGAAGVLLAVETVLTGGSTGLPFLAGPGGSVPGASREGSPE
ncbi:class III lanthionine synthetase LanKC [Streptomyces sp. SID9124]|uniref:class III lanthionine synthetase LanKC n=1 Tax=Streptomyces sp. SID9124 TaxID=2706108 RepID=UPI0013E0813A|nr:class III lanthionine synthetase LanKC [Streptomyces sp. SID9124]NED10441.1 protein kinase/lanthionine synthetase C family protein [Streptomyces sp. SID9124]